mgnify:CR=1 FL=1
MVIAETALVLGGLKAAISACKGAVDSAKDVQDIAGHLNTIFSHKDDAEKRLKRPSKKKSNKLLSFFSRKTGEDEEDDTSIAAAMDSVVQKKLLDREILNLSIKINNKFGPGTWQAIINERDKRVKIKKERDQKAAVQARKKADESDRFWGKVMVESGKILVLIFVVGGLYLYLSWAYHK